MTKVRPPVSPEQALTRVAGLIGWPEAARIVEQAERTVRNWSDPDTPAEMPLKAALKLDAAYIAAGGGTAPIFETYKQLLGEALDEACADSAMLSELTATAALEAGQAVSALVRASRPNAEPRERLRAAGEAEEAIHALQSTLPVLRADAGAG